MVSGCLKKKSGDCIANAHGGCLQLAWRRFFQAVLPRQKGSLKAQKATKPQSKPITRLRKQMNGTIISIH
jgi:hypothetical protein